MNLSDIEILPYPNAVFYLTGISVITLVYVTFANTINEIPGAVANQITSLTGSLTGSVSALGTSVREGASDLYTKAAETSKGAVDAISKSATSVTEVAAEEISAPAIKPNVETSNNAYAAPNPITNAVGSISKSLNNLNPFGQGEKPPVQTAGSAKRRKKGAKKTKRRKKAAKK